MNCMRCFTVFPNVTGICAINAMKGYLKKIAVIVIISMQSLVLHWTAEPQEALWHYSLQNQGIFNISICLKNILLDTFPFMGPLILVFWIMVTSPLGSKARVGRVIHAWGRHTWYTFPDIHFWCNTFVCVYGQKKLVFLDKQGSKARMDSLIHGWGRCMWYTFPSIHLWCDTFAGVYDQKELVFLDKHCKCSCSSGKILDCPCSLSG